MYQLCASALQSQTTKLTIHEEKGEVGLAPKLTFNDDPSQKATTPLRQQTTLDIILYLTVELILFHHKNTLQQGALTATCDLLNHSNTLTLAEQCTQIGAEHELKRKCTQYGIPGIMRTGKAEHNREKVTSRKQAALLLAEHIKQGTHLKEIDKVVRKNKTQLKYLYKKYESLRYPDPVKPLDIGLINIMNLSTSFYQSRNIVKNLAKDQSQLTSMIQSALKEHYNRPDLRTQLNKFNTQWFKLYQQQAEQNTPPELKLGRPPGKDECFSASDLLTAHRLQRQKKRHKPQESRQPKEGPSTKRRKSQ